MLKKMLRLLSVSGSIMAFHVGSGFASGQEILQFYTSYGPLGGLCMSFLAFVLFAGFSFILLETGRVMKGTAVPVLYRQLGGKRAGDIFYRITPLLMALVFCVTIAGGGAALQTLFDIPAFYGRLIVAIPVLLTVLLGLQWITILAGSLGPVIILSALCLGGYGVVQGRDTMLWTLLPHTSANWLISAVSYVCFGTITQIPFLLTVGSETADPQESATIAVLGNGGFMLTGAVLHLGLYRSLPQVLGEQLPALCLAGRISDLAWWFYGMILLFSIYTTAVPLLWSVCKALHPLEKSGWYRAGAVGLSALACVCAKLPFDQLLGILYPYIGYFSAIFFAIILLRKVFKRQQPGHRSGHNEASAA